VSRSRIASVIALLALVALTLVATRARSWFLPGGPDWVQGIDVSHHQGPINWDEVAGDDVRFAWIKATEGGDWEDPRFDENWAGAGAAGVPRGAYHFFTLCRPAAEQAAWFLSVAPAGELPTAVDLEYGGELRGPARPRHARR
jgi:lysozyme